MKIGFAVKELDSTVCTYIEVVGRKSCWTRPVADWHIFYAWVRGVGNRPLDTMVVTDMCYVPYLDYIRWKIGPSIVCLTIEEEVSWPEADANYTTYDLGWGVDRTECQKLGYRREWMRQPVFYLTEDDQEIEAALLKMGHRVVRGDSGYVMGNVAIVPVKRLVPNDIYTAMASGMPVISTAENRPWLSGFPGFEATLEDGLEEVVREVMRSDFKLLGMMAQEMVPDLATFKGILRAKLTFK
jgi:hypothetical protein